MNKEEFAEFLKFMRAETGLNQVEFSKAIGINIATYNRLERAITLPKDYEMIIDIVRYVVKKKQKERLEKLKEEYKELKESDIPVIIEQLRQGKNIAQICIQMNLDEEKVAAALKSAGVKPIAYKVKDTYWMEFEVSV